MFPLWSHSILVISSWWASRNSQQQVNASLPKAHMRGRAFWRKGYQTNLIFLGHLYQKVEVIWVLWRKQSSTMMAWAFTARLKQKEALSRILTFLALNQYHRKKYLKVQSFTKCYYLKVLHSYSTCNAEVSWMFSAWRATGFHRQAKCFWTELLYMYKENFPVDGEVYQVSRVILTANQFARCPALSHETSADDLWLTTWVFNQQLEREESFL